MRMRALMLCLALLAPWAMPLAQQPDSEPMLFRYNGPENSTDRRYDYHWRVLRAALEATVPSWGAYRMEPASTMNESRQIYEVARGSTLINMMVLDVTQELEDKLVPVRIPVDKGLLGYRVFLIRDSDQARFAAVQKFADLKKFSYGQGADWSDRQIYVDAGLKVVPGQSYEGLFHMLAAKRFDAFGRGVTEVVGEMRQFGPKHDNLAIEKDLLLYYPLPVYFWFPPTDEGRRHASRVEQGMRQLISDGTLDRLFEQEFGPLIRQLDLKNRRMFRIDNKLLPPKQPFADKRLWFSLR